MKEKQRINLVWFKRDLRTLDHEPLWLAQQSEFPCILFYCYEPSLVNAHCTSERHVRFIHESLMDLQAKLKAHHHHLFIVQSEVVDWLNLLQDQFEINALYSHQETGNAITFKRDLDVKLWCEEHQVPWHEPLQMAVFRKLKNRTNWTKLWNDFMSASYKHPDLSKLCSIPEHSVLIPENYKPQLLESITTPNKMFQPGGETFAWQYFHSFLSERHHNYSKHISKPLLSRTGCSRLSVYLAWGNISIRMVYRESQLQLMRGGSKRSIANFTSRLHWHCHFIQKFETECRMEFYNVNRAFDILEKPENKFFIEAWKTGTTGVPLVDANMRCVAATGYINFRMRAMVVSFLVFHLWQDWKHAAHHLAGMFLDYEPGIHYPQLQMQAGVTGINTIRIYNPIKNAEDHDSEGAFVKQWIPELAHVPVPHIFEPWKMSKDEQEMYRCTIGKDYPAPIVNLEEARQFAANMMWGFRKTSEVKEEGQRILKTHTHPRPLAKKPKKKKPEQPGLFDDMFS